MPEPRQIRESQIEDLHVVLLRELQDSFRIGPIGHIGLLEEALDESVRGIAVRSLKTLHAAGARRMLSALPPSTLCDFARDFEESGRARPVIEYTVSVEGGAEEVEIDCFYETDKRGLCGL